MTIPTSSTQRKAAGPAAIRPAAIRPALRCLAIGLLASRLGPAAWGAAPDVHDQSVFFENSSAATSYFYSLGEQVSPSELELVDGKCPVEVETFISPPHALRIRWTSAPGGDWRMTIKAVDRYGRRFRLEGDSLWLRCYSQEGLTPDDAPRVSVRDARGNGLSDVSLLAEHGPLPPQTWTNVRLPLANFVSPVKGTAEFEFDPRGLASVVFVQGLDDDREHTLLLDDIRMANMASSPDIDQAAPATPRGLHIVGQDHHFDLVWTPNSEADLLSYRVYRSWDGKSYEPVQTRPARYRRCVDHVGGPNRTAYYQLSAIDRDNNESPRCEPVQATTQDFDDEQLLTMVQEACFRYYWEAANRDSGMALEILPGDEDLVALGASGFGMMALLVGTEREFITREQSVDRFLQIVRFLRSADRFHGVWPHFLSGKTGKVRPYFGKYDNGGDLVETAFLVQGLLAARHYFDRDVPAEREIRETITTVWHEVEWDWYRRSPDGDVLYWHWSPDYGWHINHPLIGWNETMIVYLLAIASPTHGVPASLFHSGFAGQTPQAVAYRRNWSRTTAGDHYTNGNRYFGIPLDVGCGNGGELFFTQFSFLGFDPRGKRDRYTDYFQNNRHITLINRAYCRENPRNRRGYGPDCWGRSAGIYSGGGRPLPRDDNGTICSSAALGAFAYTPEESMGALKHFYRTLGAKTYGVYGFHDGFNQTDEWYEEVYMGLNQAQIVVMIENHRSGLIWKHFMANAEIPAMLQALKFSDAESAKP